MGDQYVCIGPYVEMKARAEIEEEDFPPHHPLGKTISSGITKSRYTFRIIEIYTCDRK